VTRGNPRFRFPQGSPDNRPPLGPCNRDRPRLRLGGSPPPSPPAAGRDSLLRQRREPFADWAARLAAARLELPRDAAGWPKPLRVGAKADVLAVFGGRLPPERLGRLLGAWCRSGAYQTSLTRSGAMRHDLDGSPMEPVASEHRQHARTVLKARRRRRTAKR
jgi:ProP effector